jgi:hypothetical protein
VTSWQMRSRRTLACPPRAARSVPPPRGWVYLVSITSIASNPSLSRRPHCAGATIQEDGWFPDNGGGGIVISDRGPRGSVEHPVSRQRAARGRLLPRSSRSPGSRR